MLEWQFNLVCGIEFISNGDILHSQTKSFLFVLVAGNKEQKELMQFFKLIWHCQSLWTDQKLLFEIVWYVILSRTKTFQWNSNKTHLNAIMLSAMTYIWKDVSNLHLSPVKFSENKTDWPQMTLHKCNCMHCINQSSPKQSSCHSETLVRLWKISYYCCC